jgi:hypothetical protein
VGERERKTDKLNLKGGEKTRDFLNTRQAKVSNNYL